MSWLRVSKQNPCPICERPDKACSVAEDGSVACCMRVPSDWVCKGNMGGWLHKLRPDLIQRVKNVFRRAPKKKPKPPKYWHAVYQDSLKAKGPPLGPRLGLSEISLARLMVGWLPIYQAWTFPMWDGVGQMVGMRLRGHGGKKWCVTDSFNGIFWPTEIDRAGNSLLMICEGPTDCAAMLDLGFEAIGRPNALGGVKYLTEFLSGGRRKVVIMADNDDESRVGWQGAVKLAGAIQPLTESVDVLTPPSAYKDIRDWYLGGGRKEDLMRLM